MLRRLMMAEGGGGGVLSAYDNLLISMGPWGYWRLNETSTPAGGAVLDVSGNARHAAFNSTGSWSPGAPLFGGNSGSVAFAGTGAKCPTQTGITASTKFSVVAWVKPSAASLMSILSSDSSAATYRLWQFRISAAGKLQYVSVPSSQTVTSAASVNDGASHLVSFVFDPALSNADGKLKLYVDGELDTKTTGAISGAPGAALPAIGARSSSTEITNEGFVGNISNAALFIGAALSAADIAALWAARNS